MQPETATLPAAMRPTSATASPDRSEEESPRRGADVTVLRRPLYWLKLFAFWTVLPFVLVPLLDMAWGHPVKLPQLSIYQMLQWWAWVPLSALIVTLGRRFPLREPGALKHAAIHFVTSWLVAIVHSLYMAAIAALLPVEWSAELILKGTLQVFVGFGALNQIVYWSVLAVSFALAYVRRLRGRA